MSAAAAAPVADKQYPAKLVEHLKPLSHEKLSTIEMFQEWEFESTEDTGNEHDECPCGKTDIRYKCHILNAKTGKATAVGTTCIQWFGEHLQSVVGIADNLMKTGITGTFKVR